MFFLQLFFYYQLLDLLELLLKFLCLSYIFFSFFLKFYIFLGFNIFFNRRCFFYYFFSRFFFYLFCDFFCNFWFFFLNRFRFVFLNSYILYIRFFVFPFCVASVSLVIFSFLYSLKRSICIDIEIIKANIISFITGL